MSHLPLRVVAQQAAGYTHAFSFNPKSAQHAALAYTGQGRLDARWQKQTFRVPIAHRVVPTFTDLAKPTGVEHKEFNPHIGGDIDLFMELHLGDLSVARIARMVDLDAQFFAGRFAQEHATSHMVMQR